jgi:hypothetical protein
MEQVYIWYRRCRGRRIGVPAFVHLQHRGVRFRRSANLLAALQRDCRDGFQPDVMLERTGSAADHRCNVSAQ